MKGQLTALGRISLLGVAVAIATVLGVGLSGEGLLTGDQRAESQTTGSPNIVLVMTDDLDVRSMQDLGGIRDLMGANGATFENAFVNYSLCCPSRATFLRGQYPHNHGITSHTSAEGEPRFRQLGRDQSTVATWLNNAGYQT